MATWNNATWNSGSLWSPASPPLPSNTHNPKKRQKAMKRKPFFPRVLSQQAEWLHNYALQLVLLNAELGLPALEVTASANDALYCEYVVSAWLTAVREFGPTGTGALNDLFYGAGADPMVLPVFTTPPLPAGVTAVPPGALDRIFLMVKAIKARPAYTETMGLQLGIVGEEDTAENPLPDFSLKIERAGGCECVKVIFKKYGRQGVVIYGRRGGGDWELLAIDLASPYLDERPLLAAGVPEIREYKLQYYDNAAPQGGFTAVQSVTVTP